VILVTSAGKVGAEAARVLAAQGIPVRLLIRDPEKVGTLARAGVEAAIGDLADRPSIDAAMRDVSGVVLVSPAVPDEEMNVVRSAAAAHVGHIVKISSKASLDSPVERRRNQARIEQGLIASGVGYTLLRNNAYMQNFLMLAPAIASTDSFSSASGDGRIGMIDTRDVAAAAAAIAAHPDDHLGRTYWPTGPESFSYADAAPRLSAVLGRHISFRSLSFAEQRQAMVDVGVPAPIAQMNAEAIALFAQGDSDWVTDDVMSITGRPPRTFDQFVTDNAEFFTVPASRQS